MGGSRLSRRRWAMLSLHPRAEGGAGLHRSEGRGFAGLRLEVDVAVPRVAPRARLPLERMRSVPRERAGMLRGDGLSRSENPLGLAARHLLSSPLRCPEALMPAT